MHRFQQAGRRLCCRHAFNCRRWNADRRYGRLFAHWRGQHLRLGRYAQLRRRGGLHSCRPGWGHPPDNGRADRYRSHPGHARHGWHRHWRWHGHDRRHGTHLGHAPRCGRHPCHLPLNRQGWQIRIKRHARRGGRNRRCRSHLLQAPWRGQNAKTRGQAIHSWHGSRRQRRRAIGNHPGQGSRHA